MNFAIHSKSAIFFTIGFAMLAIALLAGHFVTTDASADEVPAPAVQQSMVSVSNGIGNLP